MTKLLLYYLNYFFKIIYSNIDLTFGTSDLEIGKKYEIK